MKISVRNLNVITEADIDLKPLTVLVGPNNTGKTWLAYLLAGILGSYSWGEYINAYLKGGVSDTYQQLDNAVDQIINDGIATIDMVAFADTCGENYFNNVAHLAPEWMHWYLGTERISFNALDINLCLGENKEDFLASVLGIPISSEFLVGRRRQKPGLSILKESGERNLLAYTSLEGGEVEKFPREAIKRELVSTIFRALHQALYPNIYVFPTERTTFITFSFEHKPLGRKEDNDNEQSLRKFGRPMNWPVGHFLTTISTMFERGSLDRKEREQEEEHTPEIKTYAELAQILQQSILGGQVNYSTVEPSSGREILFNPRENISIEIPIASSMVKELAPLALYLRHLAEPGDLVIIDEPEMNLHPEAQVKLTEFLAMLVNAGLRVLVTTHSTYVVDHLINLMDAAKHEKQDEIVDLFFLQRPEAFIAQDNISVYLIEQGKAQNILDENGIIHWDTFSDVTDRVERIHFQL